MNFPQLFLENFPPCFFIIFFLNLKISNISSSHSNQPATQFSLIPLPNKMKQMFPSVAFINKAKVPQWKTKHLSPSPWFICPGSTSTSMYFSHRNNSINIVSQVPELPRFKINVVHQVDVVEVSGSNENEFEQSRRRGEIVATVKVRPSSF